MAKAKSGPINAPVDPDHDEWQTREDVDRLMRADEVHANPDRHRRAMHRLNSTVRRLTKKHGRGRSHSR